jgi:hypothetical protein
MKAGYGKTVGRFLRRTEPSSSLGASSDPTAEKVTDLRCRRLAEGRTPEQISGWLKGENEPISHRLSEPSKPRLRL